MIFSPFPVGHPGLLGWLPPFISQQHDVTIETVAELAEHVQRLTALVEEIHAREAAKPPIDPKARYSLADAARYLDTSTSTLKRRAAADKLAIRYDGKSPFVMGAEVLRYARDGAKRPIKRRANK